METRRHGFDSPTRALSPGRKPWVNGGGLRKFSAALPHDDKPADADDAGGAQDNEILPGE